MERCPFYSEEHLHGLYKMQEQDQLCDVTIHVGGRKFRAHKAALAATGDYFFKMFTSGFRERSAQEITIEGSPAAFEILLNFVYTGGVMHTEVASCISEVLEMACYMQFTHFVNTCSEAISKLLKTNTEAVSLSDICKVMLVAQTHDLTAVYQATLRYLKDEVERLKCLDVFLEIINATCLQDLLCLENLSNADEEEQVLELVINWLKHDWENRKKYSHQLLQEVRLGLVAPEDIKKLIGPEILEIPGCSELVNRALDLHASEKQKEILAIENPDMAATRSTIMAPVILDDGEVKYYDEKRKGWMDGWITMNKMDPLPSKSKANIYELIVVNGILYAAGGTNGREFLKYQASQNKWITLPSKPLGKNRIKLVALGAYIYAFGACCSAEDQVIERYDISAEKWEVLNKVQDKSGPNRFTLRAEVMDTTGNIGKCKCRQNGTIDNNLSRQIFAVVFEEKIIVSSLNQTYDHHIYDTSYNRLEGDLVIYDPVMNTYQIEDFGGGDIEDLEEFWDCGCFKPTLFVHEDQLYWMKTLLFREDSESPVTLKRLNVTEEDGKITVGFSKIKLKTVKMLAGLPCVEDDFTTPFYVQDRIFVKQGGTAGRTSPEHDEDRPCPYDENKLLVYYNLHDLVYPVWFSFDKKLTVQDKKQF